MAFSPGGATVGASDGGEFANIPSWRASDGAFITNFSGRLGGTTLAGRRGGNDETIAESSSEASVEAQAA